MIEKKEEKKSFNEIYKYNNERCAFDSLKLLDLEMCDLVKDSVLTRLKDMYSNIKILNYYREEVI